MKRKNVRTWAWRGLWLVILLLAGRAWAAHTYWQHDPAAAGDWFVPTNWTDGLPTRDDSAYVDNGGTVQIAAGLAQARKLFLGHAAGASGTIELSGGRVQSHWQYIGSDATSHFIQTGGINTINYHFSLGGHPPYERGGQGTYELSGGRLHVTGVQFIGLSGTGHFIQTGGVNEVTHCFYLGYGVLEPIAQGTYELRGGRLRVGDSLRIGHDATGHFIQTGGINAVGSDLRLGEAYPVLDPSTRGTYELRGGRLRVGDFLRIGNDTTGHFIQTGGINTVSRSIDLGRKGGSHGTYELSGGRVQSGAQRIGHSGTGHFIQTGGVNEVTGILSLGRSRHVSRSHGTYELSGGRLRVMGSQYVGYAGDGLFAQTGGTNAVAGTLHLARGQGSHGTYELSGGRVRSAGQRVGREGTGHFIQTGGINTAEGGLSVGGSEGGSGTYELSGGQVRSEWQQVGRSGAGHFIQTGGTNKVGDILFVGLYKRSSGTYTISGGSLSTAGLTVSLAGSGTLNITGASADITVSEYLEFGPDSTFSAVAGSTIHMRGSAFRNLSTDPAALGGLANLRLIFKGGGGAFNPVEVAGEDLGPVPAGWTDNFALGTLQLGEADAGRIQLVDGADNQQDGPGNEALYVDWLILNGGAKIDLNGLGLYFRNGGLPRQLLAGDANLDGCVDGLDYVTWSSNYGQGGKAWKDGDYNGDTVVDGLDYIAWSGNYLRGEPGGAGMPIPEPGAVALIFAGACLILPRRRA